MCWNTRTLRPFTIAVLCACIAEMTLVRPIVPQTEAATKAEFAHPAKLYRPMVRWWWPGDDVTDDEIQREIGVLDNAWIGGAEIQTLVTFSPAGLTKQDQAKVAGFATPSFFQHVRTAVEAARSRQMWIDDTFGTGWPFGGGMEITPELASLELRFTNTVVNGPTTASPVLPIPQWKPDMVTSMMMAGGRKQIWPPGWEERLEARSKIVAVIAVRSASGAQPAQDPKQAKMPEQLDSRTALVLTDRLQSDGTLNWRAPAGSWHVFVFRQIPTRQLVVGASGSGPELVLDHFNEAAFAAHAVRVGDPLIAAAGTYAGSTLRAVFCDSLEVEQFLAWSDDFLAEFRKRRGYDLTPFLPVLKQPGYNEQNDSVSGGLPLFDVAGGDSIRADYWKTVSELIFERFYRPFDQWANGHKLLARVQAHGAPGDVLKIYGDADIPETEQLGGNNTVNFMKLASSAGYDYGHSIVSSESFVFRGNPNISTPESIKANSDKLLISGVNQIIYHGFPYKFSVGINGVGWYPFRAVSTPVTETNPIWPFLGKVNEYITRLQYVAQRGKSHLQVAIYRSSLNQDDTGPSPAAGAFKDPYPAIEDTLTSSGYSFGFVNHDVLSGTVAKNGTLLTKGGGSYEALLIPHETTVSLGIARLIQRFAKARVPIIFLGGMPRENVSYNAQATEREQISETLFHLRSSPRAIQVSSNQIAARLTVTIAPQLRFVTGEPMPFLKKTLGDTTFYFLTNPRNTAASATIEFAEQVAPEVWDPWMGTTQEIAFTRTGTHESTEIQLPPNGSELIGFSAVNRHMASPVASTWKELSHQSVGESGWSVTAFGNSELGAGIEIQENMAQLTDWLDDPQFRTFSGRATYTKHVTVSASDLTSAQRVLLDLGKVKDAAEVKINGSDAGMLIVQPFALDVRSLLHPGDNQIEVTVANTLTNYVSSLKGPAVSMYQTGHFEPVSDGLLGPVFLRYEVK